MQPVLERVFRGQFGRRLAGLDLGEVAEAGRELIGRRTRTRAELRSSLGERWPDRDADALAQAVGYLVPLVQVPPRGVWGKSGQATLAPTESWLGRPLDPDPSPDEMVGRYLGAFGPASVKDVQAWCGLTRLREVVERLRPELRAFRDGEGRELFDLPDAPRPKPDTPAPPRFLPEYDNVLLSHADRGRVYGGGYRPPPNAGAGGFIGNVLVDGFFRAVFTVTLERDRATLLVTPFGSLSAEEGDALRSEGSELLRFVAGEAEDHDIRVAPSE